MDNTNRQRWAYVLGIALIMQLGCGTKLLVPPDIDLEVYNLLGMLEFTSNTEGNLQSFVTRTPEISRDDMYKNKLHVLQLAVFFIIIPDISFIPSLCELVNISAFDMGISELVRPDEKMLEGRL